MESWKNRSPVRGELGTAEAALGRVDRTGVCEHDEGVACRRVDLIARYREKGQNLRLRKAEELSQASTNNILHVVIVYNTATKYIYIIILLVSGFWSGVFFVSA